MKMPNALLVILMAGASSCGDGPRFQVAELEAWELAIDESDFLLPVEGFAPDPRTATKIAEAALEGAYGANVLRGQLPLRVTLRDSSWMIRGTLPENTLGGVAFVEISKMDGRILRMAHGQ